MKLCIFLLACSVVIRTGSQLETLYEHYAAGEITSGLVPISSGFLLNGKPYRLISGAIHYFRVHPAYWRDRLRKLRASGITAVETYVPWNLHEPEANVFNFGHSLDNESMSTFLDVVSYLKIAQEEDLFVVFRPGPYICSEWDFGGLPSWLLRDYTMQVRTMYEPYVRRVFAFFDQLMPLIKDFQFTLGGPIIAIQVENEYGAFGYGDQPRDQVYLQRVLDKMTSLGVKEMFFTSDSPLGTLDWGSVPGVLQTANFQSGADAQFAALESLQPNMPYMVTEFWSGWFDHWTETHHNGLGLLEFNSTLTDILSRGASVNFYMFHGGTNFGFMNGANTNEKYYYLPDVTSYDYDAPLSEAGDYTAKYEALSELVQRSLAVTTKLPVRPVESAKTAYAAIHPDSYLTLSDLTDRVPTGLVTTSIAPVAMEDLPINNDNGQSYGFVVYRKTVRVAADSVLTVRNHIRDFAQVLINGRLQTPPVLSVEDLQRFGSWYPRDASFTLGSWRKMDVDFRQGLKVDARMDIMVENMGRVNYGKPHDFRQKKGLWEGPNWVNRLSGWRPYAREATGPVAILFRLTITKPSDTFVDMSDWGKGVVFVNGFNLGRYWSTVGPQKTLYLPGPLLTPGTNTIIVFEQYTPASVLSFRSQPVLGTPSFK